MRQMSKPRLANQSGIDASGSPGICRSKPCEPMDEPWTSRIVAFGGPVTERFSAMNSFLPFDWVQCSWPGTARVVTAFMASPVLVLATGSPGCALAVYRGPGRGKIGFLLAVRPQGRGFRTHYIVQALSGSSSGT